MQAITVTARGGIGGNLQQLADLFKSVLVPDFQDDDLALLHRQPGQTTHRFAFLGGFRGRALFYHRLGPWHEVLYGLENALPELVASGVAGIRQRLPAR